MHVGLAHIQMRHPAQPRLACIQATGHPHLVLGQPVREGGGDVRVNVCEQDIGLPRLHRDAALQRRVAAAHLLQPQGQLVEVGVVFRQTAHMVLQC